MRKAADFSGLAVPIYEEAFKKLGRPEWEPDYKSTIRSIHADVAVAHDDGVAAALADRDLTDQGRAKAIRKLKQASLAKLERFEDTVAALRARAAEMEAEVSKRVVFAKPTDPAERLAFELRQRETRDALRGLDAVERLNAYYATTDREVREALESAPPILGRPKKNAPPVLEPFIDPETVQAVRTARIREAAPEVVAEAEAIGHLAGLYVGLISEVRAAIIDGMPSADAPTPATPKPTGDAIADAGFVRG